jgi:hypothetical protein
VKVFIDILDCYYTKYYKKGYGVTLSLTGENGTLTGAAIFTVPVRFIKELSV